MEKEKKYLIYSPDGFCIDREHKPLKESEIEPTFNEWKKRFEHQGYYSSNGGRIPLEDLADECSIVEYNSKNK